MRLPKSYIKKYGVSKRAWAEFKKDRKKSKVSSKISRSYGQRIKRRSSIMARRKSYKKRSYSRSKGIGGSLGKYAGAALYGALRERMSTLLLPVTTKMPFGNISDEIAVMGGLYVGKRVIGRKVPLVKDIATAGMIVEAARIGETIARGQLGIGSGSGSPGGSLW